MIQELLEGMSGYTGLFLACLGSGIVFPVPEDFPLLYAGARVRSGAFAWPATLAVSMAGVALRDLAAWGLGRVLGDTLLHRPWVRRLLGARRLDRARRMIRDHGAASVLAGRFLIGFRAPVFLLSGAMGIPLRAFLVFDGLGLLVAVPVVLALGWGFGAPIHEGAFWLFQRARLVAAIGLAVGVAVWIGLRWRAASGSTEPDDGG